MKRIALCVPVLAALLSSLPASADGQVRIDYFELATGLRMEGAGASAVAGKPTDPRQSIFSFSAFGRHFDADLVANGRIAAGLLTRGELSALPPIFRGALRGMPGSWVRLTLVDGKPIGAVWDGEALFLVDTAGHFGIFGPEPDALVVVRAADLHIPVDAIRFAGAPARTGSAPAPNATAQAQAAGAVDTLSALPLGLVLDAGFMEDFANPLTYALAVANVVDGIFVAQLDLHINVEHVQSYSSEPDPFTADNSNGLLDQLAGLKNGNATLRPMGIAHLLTRTELEDDIVGVATIGRVCHNREAVSLSRAIGGVATALIMAHEVGHNFGAEHDGEPGSVCASASKNYIMAPTLNDARLFSGCSVQTMRPYIASAVCKTAIPLGDVVLIAPATSGSVWYGEEIKLHYAVYNDGLESTLQNVAEFATNNAEPVFIFDLENRSCAYVATGAVTTCDLQSIASGQSEPIDVLMTPRQVGTLTLDASVSAANDGNSANNSARLAFEVRQATDLVAESRHAEGDFSRYVQPGWPVTLYAGARNDGDFPSDAFVVVSSDGGHAFAPGEHCTLELPESIRCDIGTVPPGDQRLVPFGVTVNPGLSLELREMRQENFHVDVTGTLHDIAQNNDRQSIPLFLVGSLHDVALDFVRAPGPIKVGESRIFEARVSNNGPDTAPDLVLNTYAYGLQFTEWAIDRGDCTQEIDWLVCEIDSLDSGDYFDLSVTYTSATAQTVPLSMQVYTESGVDNGPQMNGVLQADVVVTADPPPPAPNPPGNGGGGGGGKVDWLELMLLLLSSVALRQRHSPFWNSPSSYMPSLSIPRSV